MYVSLCLVTSPYACVCLTLSVYVVYSSLSRCAILRLAWVCAYVQEGSERGRTCLPTAALSYHILRLPDDCYVTSSYSFQVIQSQLRLLDQDARPRGLDNIAAELVSPRLLDHRDKVCYVPHDVGDIFNTAANRLSLLHIIFNNKQDVGSGRQ